MENHLRNTFFELLHMGLWRKGSLSSNRPPTEDEWAVVYRYALHHTLEGVLFDSFPLLTEEQLPPRALRMKWAVRVDQIERYNQQMAGVIAEQHAYFVESGTHPILLKGHSVAACYPNPLHRGPGDIDWYFQGDEYRRSAELLREKGISVKSAIGISLNYDWDDVEIEHHSRLFDLKNPFVGRYLRKLVARIGTEALPVDGEAVAILKPELQILQVNIHILKHLLGYGIGLRQICDAAILYNAHHDKIDGEALRKMYKRVGVLKWIHQLHGVLVKHMGLPEEKLPFPLPADLQADWMMEEIWQSGNFGIFDERFADGKFSFVSVRPDGARRLWRGLRLYFPYAPYESIFFPVRRATARVMAVFRF